MSKSLQIDDWFCRNRNKHFSWRDWNCCIMVDSWISANGYDSFMHLFPNQTAMSAMRHYISRKGIGGVIEEQLESLPLQEVKRPQTGDIVSFRAKGRSNAAICHSANNFIIASPKGLIVYPITRDRIIKSWRIK
jgi:hypothetical protein